MPALLRCLNRGFAGLALGWAAVPVAAFAQTDTLQFSAPAYTVSALHGAPANAIITVTRTGGGQGATSIAYAAWISGTDTATLDLDGSTNGDLSYNYSLSSRITPVAGRLSWAAGDSAAKTFSIPIRPRAPGVHRGDTTLSLRLASLSGTATYGAQRHARLTITDPSPPSAGVIKLASRWFYASRSSGVATLRLTRSGGSIGEVTVEYTTQPTRPTFLLGTSNAPALALAAPGADYTEVTDSLTWADGDTTDKLIEIPLFPAGSGLDEVITVSISNPTSPAVLGNVVEAAVTVLDDNPATQLSQSYDLRINEHRRLWLPPVSVPLRGLLLYQPGSGGDTLGVCNDLAWQQYAQSIGFGLMGFRGSMSTGEALIGELSSVLDTASSAAGRPEIRNAPLVLTGFSAGGFSAGAGVDGLSEQLLAYIPHKAADWIPRTLRPEGKAIPGLYMIGGNYDGNVEPGWAYERYLARRTAGAQVAYATDWAVGHDPFGGQGISLMWSFIADVASARQPTTGRQLPGPDPDQTVALRTIPDSAGWLSPHTLTINPFSTGSGGDGQITGGWQALQPIAPYPAHLGPPLAATWLPGEASARAYQATHSRHPISYGTEVLDRYWNNDPAFRPFQQELLFRTPRPQDNWAVGQTYDIEIQPRRLFSQVRRMVFRAGATIIGTRESPPWKISWTPPVGGIATLSVLATTHDGQTYPAFQAIPIQSAAVPGFAQFQTTNTQTRLSQGYSFDIQRSGGKTGAVSVAYTVAGGEARNNTDYILSSGTASWADGDAAPKKISFPAGPSPRRPRTFLINLGATTGGLQLAPLRDGTTGAPPDSRRASLTLTLVNDTAALPAPWTDVHVGPPRSATPLDLSLFAENTFYAQSTGGELTNASGKRDWFRFLCRPLVGDGTLVARVTATDPGALAGIMLRSTLADSSAFVYAGLTGATTVRLRERQTAAQGGLVTDTGAATLSAPFWVRIVRTGDSFATATSPNGTTWTPLATRNVALGASIQAGLALVSNSTGLQRSARWDNVSFTGAGPATASATWAGPAFAEAPADDGTIPSLRTLTLAGAAWSGVDGEDFVASGKVALAHLPPGLVAVATRLGGLELQIALHGAALAHLASDSPADLGLTFHPSALATGDPSTIAGLTPATPLAFTGDTLLATFRATQGLPKDGSQDLATPAGDGVANLLKYAFNLIGSGPGQTPSLSTPNAHSLSPDGSAGLPFVSLAHSPGSPLQLTYIRRQAASSPGIGYAVEFTDDLPPASWVANPSATETATALDATFERVVVTDSAPPSPRRFVRVRVTVNP